MIVSPLSPLHSPSRRAFRCTRARPGRRLLPAALASASLCVLSARALPQSSPQPLPQTVAPTIAQPPPAAAQPMQITMASGAADPQSFTSLPGSAPVFLYEGRPRQFLYSFATSSGYDSAVDDIPHLGGGLVAGEAYGGLLLRTRRYTLLLQHDAQLSRSFSTGVGLQQYQLTSLSFVGSRTRRTHWALLFENGYGADAARTTGNLSAYAGDTSTVPNASAAAYALVQGNVLSDHAQFSLGHRFSATNVVQLGVGSYFHHFFYDNSNDSQYSLDLDWRQRLTTRQLVGLSAEAVQENYIGVQCTTGSLSVYGSRQLSRGTTLEASAGPVFGTAYCSGTWQYNLTLAVHAGRSLQLYLGSARERNNGLISQAAWEDSAFGGLALGQPRQLQLRIDGGYALYKTAYPTLAQPDLTGYFAAAELDHRLSPVAELSLSARYFNGSGDLRIHRSVLLCTYSWSPQSREARLRRSSAERPSP